jgi:hypothetical protein
MHVHKDKGISEILLIKLVKTRGTLRGFVCSYDNNDAGNGVGYAQWGQIVFEVLFEIFYNVIVTIYHVSENSFCP